jgi:hypothetical protein
VRTLLAFLAIGALATTLGCNGPTKKQGTQQNTSGQSGKGQPSTTGAGTAKPGDTTGKGETGTTGKTGIGAGAAMVSVTPDQKFEVKQGKTKEATLKLSEKSTTAATVTPVIEKNMGLKVEVSKLAADADNVKLTLDATNAKPGTYTVNIPAGDNLKAGSFQVTVKK